MVKSKRSWKDRVPLPIVSPSTGAHPGCYQLGFEVEKQKETQWCWAAVAASVSKFYYARSRWTQCRLACLELGQSNCCKNSASQACNRAWYLCKALQRTSNLRCVRAISPGGIHTTILTCLQKKEPIALRVQWPDGGGHFVLVVGVLVGRSGRLDILISDPWYGIFIADLDTALRAYREKGMMTHLYRTQ
ncbi:MULTISPECIES: papain-like cysteine protease family protein [Herbaspirillum]|jgi:hypothetical protein|uniref:papain-like cysteine protease family protein n=1 Tax=Herbaspirillum TaxID=963 RepID=UPI000DD3F62F|nr:hypothetical protein [Herbaspirillum rubrisubalbicans]